MAEEVGALQQQMLMLQQQMKQIMALAQQAEARAQQSDSRAAHSEARLLQEDAQLAATAAARPVDPPTRAEIVDTRLLSKPKNFNGRLEEWIPGAFKIRAYLGALDGTLLTELDGVAAVAMDAVANVKLTTASQARSRQLYYILVLLLDEQALQLVRPVAVGEGYKAWKVLLERTSQIVQVAMPASCRS